MAKTSSPTLSVPDRGDPDRKRVLNLLAQRRYRQCLLRCSCSDINFVTNRAAEERENPSTRV
jgi:hypothetical protein